VTWIREASGGVLISLLIQPRASKNEVSGPQGDRLKVRLTAPPVEGAANKMVVTFMSKCLGVSKSDVEIVSGQSSRQKQVLIHGGSLEDIKGLLEKASK
jgi:uncharacterized protein (TIGR00251 family)